MQQEQGGTNMQDQNQNRRAMSHRAPMHDVTIFSFTLGQVWYVSSMPRNRLSIFFWRHDQKSDTLLVYMHFVF